MHRIVCGLTPKTCDAFDPEWGRALEQGLASIDGAPLVAPRPLPLRDLMGVLKREHTACAVRLEARYTRKGLDPAAVLEGQGLFTVESKALAALAVTHHLGFFIEGARAKRKNRGDLWARENKQNKKAKKMPQNCPNSFKRPQMMPKACQKKLDKTCQKTLDKNVKMVPSRPKTLKSPKTVNPQTGVLTCMPLSAEFAAVAMPKSLKAKTEAFLCPNQEGLEARAFCDLVSVLKTWGASRATCARIGAITHASLMGCKTMMRSNLQALALKAPQAYAWLRSYVEHRYHVSAFRALSLPASVAHAQLSAVGSRTELAAYCLLVCTVCMHVHTALDDMNGFGFTGVSDLRAPISFTRGPQSWGGIYSQLPNIFCDKGHRRGHRRCMESQLCAFLLLGRLVQVGNRQYTLCVECGCVMRCMLRGDFVCTRCKPPGKGPKGPKGQKGKNDSHSCCVCGTTPRLLSHCLRYGPVVVCARCDFCALAGKIQTYVIGVLTCLHPLYDVDILSNTINRFCFAKKTKSRGPGQGFSFTPNKLTFKF